MGTPAESASGAEESTQEPLLVFVHIQKTAGYSLRTIMLREYDGRRYIRHLPNVFSRGDRSHEEAAAIAAAPPRGLRAVHGHIMCWPDIDWPPNARLFTILRDPVDRVISHFYWLRGRDDPEMRKLDLNDAVREGLVPDNLQTRVLAARTEPFGELPDGALEQAIENLDKFSVIGLTHRFDESLMLLSRTLGWQRVTYQRANVTERRERRQDLPEETLALIRRFNALDEQLFAHACARFERDVAAQGRGFEIEVAALKAANARYAELVGDSVLDAKLPAISPLPTRIDTEKLLVDAHAELLAREEIRLAESERLQKLERERESSKKETAGLRRRLAARDKRHNRLMKYSARLETELRELRRQVKENAEKPEKAEKPQKAEKARRRNGVESPAN